MSAISPKTLSDEEKKKVFKTSLLLFKRVFFPSFIAMALSGVLLFLCLDFFEVEKFLRSLFFILCFFIVLPGVLFSIYDSAAGASMGPETVFINAKRYFKDSSFYKVDWLLNAVILTVFFVIAVVMSILFPEDPKNQEMLKDANLFYRYFVYVGNYMVLGIFLKLSVERIDFIRLLMCRKGLSFSEGRKLENLGLQKNPFIINQNTSLVLIFYICFIFSLSGIVISWLMPIVLIFHYCYLVSLFRAIYDDKGDLEKVKEPEVAPIPAI